MFIHRLLFALIFIACCLTTLTNGASLPNGEVEALRSIGNTLGKTDWNFNSNPCDQGDTWLNQSTRYYANNVTCDCSFNNNTTCHVTHILLKAQNLSGTLPLNLTSLPYLQEIDLTRNYLNGTIPSEWGSATRLVSISLLGNRLTGSIPRGLANLRNLTSLVLENNRLSGTLPAALGNLPKIERLHLSSNNFTGEIPEMFANLTSLKEFRISDNNFTGQIPDFIFRNWTNLEQIYIEASGLSGPIPSINATLENLEYIIISDLNGANTTFSQLVIDATLPKLDRFMLRSCNLIGEIPASFGTFTSIKILDLSFNRLSGKIPDELSNLDFDNMFLNGNNFNGSVPQWILDTREKVDLSYNNFTNTGVSDCRQNSVNLFSSIARVNNTGIVPCLTSQITCPSEPLQFVHINCGGREITVNDTIYEADYDGAGPSTFYRSTNWAFSSTGIFLSDDRPDDILVLDNRQVSVDGDEKQLYESARLAPSSLTYYAFCLANATYSVNLHFAEIQFTNDRNYSSLGRRIFDVYIQGKQELKDFNIEEEAGGAGIPKVKNFTVNVTDSTLEIRFQWAGKGTTSIPERSIYGPLISAISILDPTYKPPSESDGGIATAAVVGIVGGAVFAALLILGILWWKGCLKQKSTLEQDLKGIELQTTSFTLRQIKAATNDFHASNKIGEGGFGPVYKGTLADGTVIAVKQLSARSKQGNREFVTEIGMISALQHPHLVKLYGCCIEGNQLMLIYEYLENNSLARALFGTQESQLTLDWPTRMKICIGIARGLAYLHEESRLKIVHRDIKATNVLLDKNLNPKISDFGLASYVGYSFLWLCSCVTGGMVSLMSLLYAWITWYVPLGYWVLCGGIVAFYKKRRAVWRAAWDWHPVMGISWSGLWYTVTWPFAFVWLTVETVVRGAMHWFMMRHVRTRVGIACGAVVFLLWRHSKKVKKAYDKVIEELKGKEDDDDVEIKLEGAPTYGDIYDFLGLGVLTFFFIRPRVAESYASTINFMHLWQYLDLDKEVFTTAYWKEKYGKVKEASWQDLLQWLSLAALLVAVYLWYQKPARVNVPAAKEPKIVGHAGASVPPGVLSSAGLGGNAASNAGPAVFLSGGLLPQSPPSREEMKDGFELVRILKEGKTKGHVPRPNKPKGQQKKAKSGQRRAQVRSHLSKATKKKAPKIAKMTYVVYDLDEGFGLWIPEAPEEYQWTLWENRALIERFLSEYDLADLWAEHYEEHPEDVPDDYYDEEEDDDVYEYRQWQEETRAALGDDSSDGYSTEAKKNPCLGGKCGHPCCQFPSGCCEHGTCLCLSTEGRGKHKVANTTVETSVQTEGTITGWLHPKYVKSQTMHVLCNDRLSSGRCVHINCCCPEHQPGVDYQSFPDEQECTSVWLSELKAWWNNRKSEVTAVPADAGKVKVGGKTPDEIGAAISADLAKEMVNLKESKAAPVQTGGTPKKDPPAKKKNKSAARRSRKRTKAVAENKVTAVQTEGACVPEIPPSPLDTHVVEVLQQGDHHLYYATKIGSYLFLPHHDREKIVSFRFKGIEHKFDNNLLNGWAYPCPPEFQGLKGMKTADLQFCRKVKTVAFWSGANRSSAGELMEFRPDGFGTARYNSSVGDCGLPVYGLYNTRWIVIGLHEGFIPDQKVNAFFHPSVATPNA